MKWGINLQAALLSCFFIGTLLADVTTDGSVGRAVSLTGPNYQIGADLGKLSSTNLFHSFDKFSIGNNEKANFSGPNATQNIIARVTGGQSDIDGEINTSMPNANLFLINPEGIVFGKDAQINIQGSFYASTANHLEFKNGEKFHSDLTNRSSFSAATPVAFGFLSGNPAPITIKSKNIKLGNNQKFTLAGGNIDISIDEFGEGIHAGHINLFSIGQINQDLRYSLETQPLFDSNKLGKINLHGHAKLVVSTRGNENAGNILIHAGELMLSGGAKINSDSRGSGGSGNITINAKQVRMANRTEITSDSYADGNSGDINIITDSLNMKDSSLIDASTYAGSGNSGNITVKTQTLSMRNDATIATLAHQNTAGNASNININARNISIIGESNGVDNSAVILSNTLQNSQGHGGEIRINTETLELKNEGTISVASEGINNAGNINIVASTNIIANNGYILSKASTGNGGDIEISAGDMIDLLSTKVSTNATGNGGNINLSSNMFILDRSGINASSTNRAGGNIDLNINTYIRSKDAKSDIKATGVIDGNITISSPEVNLGKLLKNLNIDLLTNSIKDPCSIQVASEESSLAIRKNNSTLCSKNETNYEKK